MVALFQLAPFTTVRRTLTSSLTGFFWTERTLGGLDVFLPYVKDYVETFMGKSITTQDWKDHLFTYYRTHGTKDDVKALDSIDWNVCPSL